MADTPRFVCASSVLPGDCGSSARALKEARRVPPAWLEIESLTFGEFKQVVRVPFHKGQVIRIGRDSGKCHLRLKARGVSPVHCEIYSVLFDEFELYPPLIYVRDYQSASGTFVNGHRIGEQPHMSPAWLLENNDVISVGPCSLRLCDYDAQSSGCGLSPIQRQEASVRTLRRKTDYDRTEIRTEYPLLTKPKLFANQFIVKDILLGKGGFASVYLALDVRTNQQVVCRVLDLATLKTSYETIQGRIDREMAIWSQLDHPNIVAFHRAFQTENTMFTFGELATAGDLYSLLEREQTMSETELKWIVIQMLRAIDYLHSKGVAHRDIKPENILCSVSPHTHHRILLADFGCAGLASLGRLTSEVGSNVYRAPETLLSEKPHGVAVDIWSVGILILQLLAGNHSINSLEATCSAVDIEMLVLRVNIERSGQENGPISPAGVDFILTCLNMQPFLRPSAAVAAKHLWLRESAEQVALFREREKQLAWRPRGIAIPAVVRLPGISERSQMHQSDSEGKEQPFGKRIFLPRTAAHQEDKRVSTAEVDGASTSPCVVNAHGTARLDQRYSTALDLGRSHPLIFRRNSLL